MLNLEKNPPSKRWAILLAEAYLASDGVLPSATGAGALVSAAVVVQLHATIESAITTRIAREINFFIIYIYA